MCAAFALIDVILYDLDRAWCPPELNAPVGGSEVELYQLRDAFTRAGLHTELVLGRPAENMGPCRTLIYWRQVEPTPWCQPERTLVRATDDKPDGHGSAYTNVCVSRYQANKFSTRTIVIPPMLGQHVYEMVGAPKGDAWIYASAANKGVAETVAQWRKNPRSTRLWVTTTGYDDPDPSLFEGGPGVMYLGRLSPIMMARAMSACRGMYYRNCAPETFGVTTAMAVALGLELDIECVGHDVCGLAESRVPQDLREETIVKLWREILS